MKLNMLFPCSHAKQKYINSLYKLRANLLIWYGQRESMQIKRVKNMDLQSKFTFHFYPKLVL
jgi:hypothetical protein